MSVERFFAYVCTDTWGSMDGRIKLGEHILEREYKGNGSYTWTIYDFGKDEVTGTFTGLYVGQVTGSNGKLDDASKRKLKRGTARV
jgi:hypothetical protein